MEFVTLQSRNESVPSLSRKKLKEFSLSGISEPAPGHLQARCRAGCLRRGRSCTVSCCGFKACTCCLMLIVRNAFHLLPYYLHMIQLDISSQCV